MALSAEERRAAAAARRAKLLAKGDSRMAQVTGTIAKPEPSPSEQTSISEPTPSEIAEQVDLQSSMPSTSSISAFSVGEADTTLEASAGPSSRYGDDTAATTSAPLKGTAAGIKWSTYEHTRTHQLHGVTRRRRKLTASERLDIAVINTKFLRLFIAILQGLLIFALWRLSETPAPHPWSLKWHQRSLTRAWHRTRRTGWRGTWRPLVKELKTVAVMKATTQLKIPPWAAASEVAQHHPMALLFAANVALIFAAYVGLWLMGGSSSRYGRSGITNLGSTADGTAGSQMIWKMLGMISPKVKGWLQHLFAWQRMFTSLIDSAVVMVVTLATCQLVRQLNQEEGS